MKPTYRHLIKILSCSLAIAAVLLASMFVPVNAVDNVLYVWDYLTDYYEENGVLNYSFSFQDIPTYYTLVRSDTDNSVSEGYPPISIGSSPATTWVQVHAWPLGVRNWPNSVCNGGVIAVSDFNRFMSVELSATGSLFFLYSGTTSGAAYQFTVKSYWTMNYYDAAGNYLGYDNSGTEEKTITYYTPVTEIPVQSLGAYMDLELPEEAAYFCPMLKSQLYLPDQGGDFVYEVKSSFDGFTLGCSASSVMQNTETLMRIEEQLGDLNGKADTIISGSDEMQDAADDFSGTADNAQPDMDAALDRLEELPEANADDVDLTFAGLTNDKGFKQYSNFFMTLAEDTLWINMMIIVCSFIWVSTLLYGKRG